MIARLQRRFLPVLSSRIAPTKPAPKLKARLGCEPLERRDVPAVYYWNPIDPITHPTTDHLAGTASNWVDQYGERMIVAPDSDDDLYFDGSVDLDDDDDCIFSSAAGTQFSSIHLVFEWSGTVTFQTNITFGGFEQDTGNIAQTSLSASQRNNLTVTNSFDWTGGVLNSTGDAGIVTLTGVTDATIGNEADKNYILGSDLKLISGTTMIASGSIVLNNDAGLVVGTGCSFDTLEEEEQPASPPSSPTAGESATSREEVGRSDRRSERRD